MVIRVKRHANVSKQARLLDGLDVSPLKWRVCGCGQNRFVHEGMNHISNVEVHLKTRSGNVNTVKLLWLELVGTICASSTHPCVRAIPSLTIFKLVHVYSMSSQTSRLLSTKVAKRT